MKRNLWLLMLMTGAACAAFGCAALSGVPRGSVMLGVYKGSFNGVYNEGSCEIRLYQTPDGTKLFWGDFGEAGSYLNFKGAMQDGELKGQILLPLEGTVSGKLSSDGQSLSGEYKFTIPPFDHGTWQVRKQ